MTIYRNVEIELLDHTIGQKGFTTLGAFLDANEADEDFCDEALYEVMRLKPGKSWFFAPGIGDNYEIRLATAH